MSEQQYNHECVMCANVIILYSSYAHTLVLLWNWEEKINEIPIENAKPPVYRNCNCCVLQLRRQTYYNVR